MTSIPGVDYAWSHPGGGALRAAEKRFACRYLSHDPKKSLHRAEADDLAAHGVWSVVVWETTANRAGTGRAAGIADAHDAVAQATAAGMPDGRPIYLAVDYDANPEQVAPYFQGAASVLGVARTGVYGGYTVVRYLLDHGLARWAWQTAAWSAGRWDPRAVIRQPATTVRINGVTCDNDTALATDYGQWMPGTAPTLEEDMPLTADEWTKLRGIVHDELAGLLTTRYPSVADPSRTLYLRDHLRGAGVAAVVRASAQQSATAVVAGLAPLIGTGVDTAAVVKAVQDAIASAAIDVDVRVHDTTEGN